MILMLTQMIIRWLMLPKVWRFVCFASSIVGLLCYALSSSFHNLFGKWTWWKILIYSLFSFIICLAILFSKAWQHSTSLRLKAHLAFLVLTITCVYSFFFDKVVKGKPDAYSLISCAMLSITSLGLSRQTHCGVEIDLLYFFCGGLTLQLMKIKLWLVIVGVSFCYSLIVLRSSFDATPENAHLGLQPQDQVVIEVNSDSEANPDISVAHLIMPQEAHIGNASILTFDAPNGGDLRVQEQIASHANSLSQESNSDISLIMSRLMASIKTLAKKNKKVIRMLSMYVNQYLEAVAYSKTTKRMGTVIVPDTDVNFVVDALTSEIINDLQANVKLAVAGGFEKECCQVYNTWRREFLRECLWRYGLKELDMEDVDMMEKTECWRKALNVAVRILFPIERRLCDRVFIGLPSTADNTFTEVCKGMTIILLRYVDNIINGCHVPNLLCRIISKVDETLSELHPEFESLLYDWHSVSVSIKNELHVRFRKATRGVFDELETLISRDMELASVPSDEFDSIISQVVHCLRRVCRASYVINHGKDFEDNPVAPNREGKSPFSVQIARIIEMLVCNLEAKFENYTNPALGYVFMMNNLKYLERWTTNHPLRDFLDSDRILKLAAKAQENLIAEYQGS